VHSYEIKASSKDLPAHAMKILLYSPGCIIQNLILEFSGSEHVTKQFVCEHLPVIKLTGQLPPELAGKENAEIVIRYMAYWSHEFFGIADGPVSSFEIAKATPASDGRFEIDLPDFAQDRTSTTFTRPADFQLTLRDSKTWNPIARNLEPELPEFRTRTRELLIQSVYPANMRFLPSPTLAELRQHPAH
jgi:hypothetical protein